MRTSGRGVHGTMRAHAIAVAAALGRAWWACLAALQIAARPAHPVWCAGALDAHAHCGYCVGVARVCWLCGRMPIPHHAHPPTRAHMRAPFPHTRTRTPSPHWPHRVARATTRTLLRTCHWSSRPGLRIALCALACSPLLVVRVAFPGVAAGILAVGGGGGAPECERETQSALSGGCTPSGTCGLAGGHTLQGCITGAPCHAGSPPLPVRVGSRIPALRECRGGRGGSGGGGALPGEPAGTRGGMGRATRFRPVALGVSMVRRRGAHLFVPRRGGASNRVSAARVGVRDGEAVHAHAAAALGRVWQLPLLLCRRVVWQARACAC